MEQNIQFVKRLCEDVVNTNVTLEISLMHKVYTDLNSLSKDIGEALKSLREKIVVQVKRDGRELDNAKILRVGEGDESGAFKVSIRTAVSLNEDAVKKGMKTEFKDLKGQFSVVEKIEVVNKDEFDKLCKFVLEEGRNTREDLKKYLVVKETDVLNVI